MIMQQTTRSVASMFNISLHNCIFLSFSVVQIYELSYIHLYSSPSTGILQTHKVASSQLAW